VFHTKKAFTMIELVFVIVVLGILAAIAIPKFAATRDDAKISSGRATIASIRSGIVSERQTRLLRGDNTWIANLDSGGTIFGAVLTYGAGNYWTGSSPNYTYTVGSVATNFTYDPNTGRFDCTANTGYCNKLTR
jgi:general secretion pathway protein G